MATDQSYAVFGLAEHELGTQLEEERVRAMRAEGEAPTVHAIAHSICAEMRRSRGARRRDARPAHRNVSHGTGV